MIVARDRHGLIGTGKDLPWRIRADLKYFRSVTLGKPIIMGRTTWESIQCRPLSGRVNIVLSRDGQPRQGAHTCGTLESALALAQTHLDDTQECCIIGGAQVYRAAMPHAHKLYITQISHTFDTAPDESRVVFDMPCETDWPVRESHTLQPGADTDYPLTFLVLARRADPLG